MESSVLCGALAPLFQRTLNRAYLPTFTGEENYRLSLRIIRRLRIKNLVLIKERAFQAGRRKRGNVMPLGKERAQLGGVLSPGAHQAFDMPSQRP